MGENHNSISAIDGSVYVKDREIIVKNPENNGKLAIISPPSRGELYINEKRINKPHSISEDDYIEFKEFREQGQRIIDISLNEDKTEAYISITYKKEIIYYLKDIEASSNLILDIEAKEEAEPPIINESELNNELKKVRISYGIDNDAIKYIASSGNVYRKIIARGIKAKEPIEDSIKIFFNSSNKIKIDDDVEKVDYRDFNFIVSVKAGEVLAEIIKGENGVDGRNVFSEKIPGKEKKKIVFSAGQGSKLKDNLIISTIDGKPCFDKGKVWVEPMYVLNKDVTISTGNIKFPANVQINGKVTEGMSVYSEGSVLIKNGVFSGFIEAKDTSEIKGNIVSSIIDIGGKDLIKEKRIKELRELKDYLKSLINNIVYLKDHNFVQNNVTYGMIIKSLIETKYKNIPKVCIKIISHTMQDDCHNSRVVKLVKEKLIGAAPSNIKNINELDEIMFELDKEIEDLEKEVVIASDLIIEYAQESQINVMGNINITGKGLFTSKLYASCNINFLKGNSVCRGGHLKAGKLIKASIIGSESGVVTSLEVEKDGEINVDIAYHNTIFIIGNKKYILEKPSKNVHAYIEKDGSLNVEKLLL